MNSHLELSLMLLTDLEMFSRNRIDNETTKTVFYMASEDTKWLKDNFGQEPDIGFPGEISNLPGIGFPGEISNIPGIGLKGEISNIPGVGFKGEIKSSKYLISNRDFKSSRNWIFRRNI